jgi:hypothetical protein
MEFKSLKNIESSFRQIRLFAIVFVCICTAIVVYSLWKAFNFATHRSAKKSMCCDGESSLILALSQTYRMNRPRGSP